MSQAIAPRQYSGDTVHSHDQSRQQVRALRDEVHAQFDAVFTSAGSALHSPGPLIPRVDDTVLFTGSTISTFKPYLLSNAIPSGGFHMVQRCLRTQNTSKLSDATSAIQWASYFSSIGAVAQYEQLPRLLHNTWHLFAEKLSLADDRLLIRVSSADHDLVRAIDALGLTGRASFDTEPHTYYQHRFGLTDISGRNCNIAVRGPDGDTFRDVGNVIVIEQRGKPIAMEVAFGVETIASRVLGLASPIHASPIADIIPLSNDLVSRLADALAAAMAILHAGIRPIATNRGRVLRKYLHGIHRIKSALGITNADVAYYAATFEARELSDRTTLPEQLAHYLTVCDKMISANEPSEQINRRAAQVFQ
jgi:hypothetical protein